MIVKNRDILTQFYFVEYYLSSFLAQSFQESGFISSVFAIYISAFLMVRKFWLWNFQMLLFYLVKYGLLLYLWLYIFLIQVFEILNITKAKSMPNSFHGTSVILDLLPGAFWLRFRKSHELSDPYSFFFPLMIFLTWL